MRTLQNSQKNFTYVVNALAMILVVNILGVSRHATAYMGSWAVDHIEVQTTHLVGRCSEDRHKNIYVHFLLLLFIISCVWLVICPGDRIEKFNPRQDIPDMSVPSRCFTV